MADLLNDPPIAAIDIGTNSIHLVVAKVSPNGHIRVLDRDKNEHESTAFLRLNPMGRVPVLEAEGVAYDIGAYKDAPPGLRIWCGATVESSDLQALMPWLTWAYQKAQAA